MTDDEIRDLMEKLPPEWLEWESLPGGDWYRLAQTHEGNYRVDVKTFDWWKPDCSIGHGQAMMILHTRLLERLRAEGYSFCCDCDTAHWSPPRGHGSSLDDCATPLDAIVAAAYHWLERQEAEHSEYPMYCVHKNQTPWAYVRFDSAQEEGVEVRRDGSESKTRWNPAERRTHVANGNWRIVSEAEAKARVKQPEQPDEPQKREKPRIVRPPDGSVLWLIRRYWTTDPNEEGEYYSPHVYRWFPDSGGFVRQRDTMDWPERDDPQQPEQPAEPTLAEQIDAISEHGPAYGCELKPLLRKIAERIEMAKETDDG